MYRSVACAVHACLYTVCLCLDIYWIVIGNFGMAYPTLPDSWIWGYTVLQTQTAVVAEATP
jgi:hypothetical protein